MGVFTWEIRDKYVVSNVDKLGGRGSKGGKKMGISGVKRDVSFVDVIGGGRFGPHNLAQLNFF